MQSSNVVSVLVLAFVWTWILSLTSALAVILWSNIGTMLTSSVLWIVWLSLNVSMIALPLVFLGAVWMGFLSRWDKAVAVSKFANEEKFGAYSVFDLPLSYLTFTNRNDLLNTTL